MWSRWNIYLSLHDVQFATFRQVWNFVGLENYRVLIEDSLFPCKFHKSLGARVQFVGGSVPGRCVMVAGLTAGAIKG